MALTSGTTMTPRSHRLRGRGHALVRLMAMAALGLALAALPAVAPSSATGTTAARHSCSPPPGVSCLIHVPYLDDGSSKHTLDVYYPTYLTDRASVMILHGGYWMRGGSRIFAPEAKYFAENGFTVFAINFARSRPN